MSHQSIRSVSAAFVKTSSSYHPRDYERDIMLKERYEKEMAKDMPNMTRVEVIGGSYDRGIVAGCDIEKGDVIFREDPVATLQHHYNKICLPACRKCNKTIGSLRTRIGAIFRSDRTGPSFFESE